MPPRIPLVITPEIKRQIADFKQRLMDIKDHPEESSDYDVRTIDIILNELIDYDRNFIIAYYTIANCNKCELARIMGTSPPVIADRLKNIVKIIHKLNDVPKTPNNQPRSYPDC